MKIAVVGCGAVGSYYGARLARIGHDVHFLLRSDYDAVVRHGVQIHSPLGDFTVKPKCARVPSEVGTSDVILIGLKTTANDLFERLLKPLVGPGTAVVTLQNGLGNEGLLAKLFPVRQILGGLCFVCLNRVQPGVIHHIDHGQIILGEYLRPPEPRTHELAAALRKAGIPCTVSDDLERTHWEKLVWNIPFNGLGVAGTEGYEAVVSGVVRPGALRGPCLATDKLLGDPAWAALVRELMLEVVTGATAVGKPIDPGLVDHQINRTRSMGAYRASTLIDFDRGQPLELESLFLEPLRQIRGAGAAAPRLERLCRVLETLSADACQAGRPALSSPPAKSS